MTEASAFPRYLFKQLKEKKWETDKNKNLSDEDKKAWYIHFVADLDMIFNGREIDSKDDDIENSLLCKPE